MFNSHPGLRDATRPGDTGFRRSECDHADCATGRRLAGGRFEVPSAASSRNSKAGLVSEDEVLAFVRNAIGSVWTIELLVLLRHDPDRTWQARSLITDLRASPRVVGDSLSALEAAGLVSADEAGLYRYHPVSPMIDETARELVDLYARKPMTVVNTILSSPTNKIQTFADAFRFRK